MNLVGVALQRNPLYVSVRGMDALAAPLLLLFYDKENVALACLEKLLQNFQQHLFAADSAAFLRRQLVTSNRLLLFIDPQLALHMNTLGIYSHSVLQMTLLPPLLLALMLVSLLLLPLLLLALLMLSLQLLALLLLLLVALLLLTLLLMLSLLLLSLLLSLLLLSLLLLLLREAARIFVLMCCTANGVLFGQKSWRKPYYAL